MNHLPNDIYELIGEFADIDTRRNMGLPPRKLIICEKLQTLDRFLKRTLQRRNVKVLGSKIYTTMYLGMNDKVHVLTYTCHPLMDNAYIMFSCPSNHVTITAMPEGTFVMWLKAPAIRYPTRFGQKSMQISCLIAEKEKNHILTSSTCRFLNLM